MRGTTTRLAGDLFENISKVPGGKKFLDKGGKELAGQSVPGALITTALTTLSTGNPFAGLLVGGADLVASTVLARALATDKLRRGLKHVTGKDINLGGGFDRALDATKVDKMTNTELKKYIASQPLKYRASGPQCYQVVLEQH